MQFPVELLILAYRPYLQSTFLENSVSNELPNLPRRPTILIEEHQYKLNMLTLNSRRKLKKTIPIFCLVYDGLRHKYDEPTRLCRYIQAALLPKIPFKFRRNYLLFRQFHINFLI